MTQSLVRTLEVQKGRKVSKLYNRYAKACEWTGERESISSEARLSR